MHSLYAVADLVLACTYVLRAVATREHYVASRPRDLDNHPARASLCLLGGTSPWSLDQTYRLRSHYAELVPYYFNRCISLSQLLSEMLSLPGLNRNCLPLACPPSPAAVTVSSRRPPLLQPGCWEKESALPSEGNATWCPQPQPMYRLRLHELLHISYAHA